MAQIKVLLAVEKDRSSHYCSKQTHTNTDTDRPTCALSSRAHATSNISFSDGTPCILCDNLPSDPYPG